VLMRSDSLAVSVTSENLEHPFQAVVKVLLISPFDEDHEALGEILRHSKWEQHSSRTQAEALKFIRTNPTPVVICESELPDGTWKGLLDEFACMPYAPALAVSSRLADDVLWSEALNLGAYSVLTTPFDMKEVFHVVSCAWLNWKRQWEPRQRETVRSHSPWPETERNLLKLKAAS
jgi:DNA-binding NtrC family response regulator